MENKSKVILVFFMGFLSLVYGQDTLKTKTLKELDKLAVHEFNKGNIEKSRVYADYQIAKAKQLGDSLKVAMAFYTYTKSDDFNTAIKYTDSVIYYSRNVDSHFYPAYGYIFKALILRRNGRYKSAMDNLIIAEKLAEEKNNIGQQANIMEIVAAIKSYLGKYDEALEMQKTYYKYLLKHLDSSPRMQKNHLKCLFNLSLSYLKVKKRDSARIYYKLALDKAYLNKDYKYLNKIGGLHSQIDFYDSRYLNSLDTLNKYRPRYVLDSITNIEKTEFANNLYYSGKIHKILKNDDEAIHYLTKMDTVIQSSQIPFFHAKDGYGELADLYKQRQDPINQLKYINRYLWVDSVLIDVSESLNPVILSKYDTPKIISERNLLLNKSNKKDKYITSILFVLLVFLVIIVVFFIKAQRLKKRVSHLIKSGTYQVSAQSEVFNNQDSKSKQLDIPNKVVEIIQMSLKEFEESKMFLDKNLSLGSLAKNFDTNSTYLSSYINSNIGKSFPNYLKSLRINYAIEQLRSNADLYKYSIKGLADEFGFLSGDAFSRAFLKETNIKPSTFLKQLKKNKK